MYGRPEPRCNMAWRSVLLSPLVGEVNVLNIGGCPLYRKWGRKGKVTPLVGYLSHSYRRRTVTNNENLVLNQVTQVI